MSDRVPPKTAFSLVVRKRHYETARVGCPFHCVIAVAFKEAFPDVGPLRVGSSDLAVVGRNALTEWSHDGEDIVWRFDNGLEGPRNAPPVRYVTLTYNAQLSYGEVERRDGLA